MPIANIVLLKYEFYIPRDEKDLLISWVHKNDHAAVC